MKTLAEIIAKRNQSGNDKLRVKYYESEVLGGQLEIRKIPLQKYMEISERIGSDEQDTVDGMNELIYECCPIFKTDTKEAIEAYGVAEALDLPSAVLEDQLNEINDIVEIINSFYGLDKIDDTLKN